jgi:hypothetical protein
MAVYFLTTGVFSGQGTIKQPGCAWAEKGPSQTDTCIEGFEEGSSVQIIATPSSSTWSVGEWSSSVAGVFSGPTGTSTSVTITMPSQDVVITVSFVPDDVTLTMDVGNSGGCVDIISPVGFGIDCSGETIIIPSAEVGIVRAFATPNSGFKVQKWEVDGVDQSSTAQFLDVDLYGSSSKNIIVYFESVGDCTKKTLTVSINGKGSVSPPSGEYCEELVLALNPVPASGYLFSGWEYDLNSGISVDGSLLLVPINVNRSVSANFEPIKGFVESDAVLFYCPSDTYKDNIVSFDFINSSNDPSIIDKFHFRVNFYTDSSRNVLVYSTFSLQDNKRWFYNDNSFYGFPEDGLVVGQLETINIVYDPEILPHAVSEIQPFYSLNDVVVYEKPLLCNVKYYVKIEAYNIITNEITFIDNISLILPCEEVNSFYWNVDEDKNNWLSSGQGKMDLQVTSSISPSVNSSISSNNFGIFQIIWQGRRDDVYNIYGAKWDSEKDILYSSGQGIYNTLEISKSYNPIVISDQSNNFYITGNVVDSIKFKACGLNICKEDSLVEDTSGVSSFESICFPGSANLLSTSYDQIKVRVYDEDIAGSLVVNDDKAVPVINNKSIRLDVDGIIGAYAVRLRNIEDDGWGEWINIDSKLYGTETGEDIVYDAYRIDNSRFIVPWNISSSNGLRRICCQVLTLYGISNTFCVDILANFDISQHVFEFYSDSTFETEFPTYDGKYILSIKNAQVVNDDGSAIVYFKAIFNKPIYLDETTKTSYADGDIKFNVIQQGINDIRKLDLKVTGDDKTFTGQFDIMDDDGIFNKDGTAFIELIIPGSVVAEICGSDNSDKYNIVNSDLEEISNVDLIPEEVYDKYKAERLSKTLEINKFKQYYDKDDNNFKFGDPGYHRN